MSSMENLSDVNAVLQRADALVASGSWDDAIQLLSESNRLQENEELETTLVSYRHRAFAELVGDTTAAPWPKPAPDRFSDHSTIPEIKAHELNAEVVASAMQHNGSLLVRGMINPEAAAAVREAIDQAFDAAAQVEKDLSQPVHPWYVPFKATEGYKFGGGERAYAKFGQGVHAVDSPRALFRHLDALRAAGFNEMLWEYFGERPGLSAKKSTLRRTEPDALAGWHQDGAFLGSDTRSLNIWTAFSPCGVDAPSLDVFPMAFKDLVKTGGEDIFDWSVSNETAATFGEDKIVRPVFEAGDALLFDQLTLHRTGVEETMTQTRYAIEMWFFAASTYPHEQIPLCV